jgi:hypothetical protein
MSHSNFSFVFEGDAVNQGEIDVANLAPALLGLSRAVKVTGQIILGPHANVTVKVRAVRHGSFEVLLNAVTNGDVGLIWGMVKSFYGSDDGQTAKAVIETLVGGGTIVWSVIGFIRWLGGGKIDHREKVDEFNDRVISDGRYTDVPRPVLEATLDPEVRAALQQTIAIPLQHKGIRSVTIKSNEHSEIIDENESSFFTLEPIINDDFVSIYQKIFSIQTVSFKTGNKWRLSDGRGTKSVTMLDEEFMSRVKNGAVSFSANDLLICDVRETVKKTRSDLKSNFEILKVIKHVPHGSEPPSFP